jgi:dihydrodipicolinate synthase/N-acetylneuraminate lyase
MPACQTTDVHAAIWNKLDGGDEAGARAIFNRLLPLLNIEARHGVAIYKEVLRRRGVISSANLRGRSTSPLDAADHRELDIVLRDVADLYTV